MLPEEIQSPGQLLGMALSLEREGAKHYADMATRMGRYDNETTTAVYERLAIECGERAAKIAEWARLENIRLVEPDEPISWEDPSRPTTYDAEARDPYRATPYKALAYAVNNADRRFTLHTNIAGTTADEQTKFYAGILAGDALNRSRLLQARRRRAYREEQRGPWQQQLEATMKLRSVAELHAVAAAFEQRLTDLLKTMATYYEDLQDIAVRSQASVDKCTEQFSGSATQAPPPPYDMEKAGQDVHQDILLVFAECERAFNFYDAVMAHALDEDIMLAAQELSESALTRLQAIREVQRKYGVPSAA